MAELPHAKVSGILRLAHCGVLLRHRHPVNEVSSPTKFGEYLAAGLPVLMTDSIGDFSGVARSKSVGLIIGPRFLESGELPEHQLEHIIEFVRESMTDRRIIAARCQKVAREELHWDKAARNMLAAYSALLQATPDSPAVPERRQTARRESARQTLTGF
jgi:hypothetical protein